MLNADQTADQSGTPTPGFKFHDANLKDFAPRIGLAYRAREKTAVAGFGIYYNLNHFNNFTLLTNNPPFTNARVHLDPANRLTLDNLWVRRGRRRSRTSSRPRGIFPAPAGSMEPDVQREI